MTILRFFDKSRTHVRFISLRRAKKGCKNCDCDAIMGFYWKSHKKAEFAPDFLICLTTEKCEKEHKK